MFTKARGAICSFRIPAAAICFLGLLTSCPHNPPVLGPFRVTAPVGDASFVSTLFGGKGGLPVTTRQKFCDMPSEEELQDEVLQVGNVDLSTFIQLHELQLVKTTITATSGDFGFVTDMTVKFIPKPGSGSPVVIGTASNPNGFDTEIVLEPTDSVDFLELIRANDAGDPNTCPKLEYTITFSQPWLSDVEYHVDVTVDGYVEVEKE